MFLASALVERKINFLAVGWYMKQDFSAFVTSDISKSAYVILSEIEFQAYWLIWADIHLKLGGITGILSRYFSGLWPGHLPTAGKQCTYWEDFKTADNRKHKRFQELKGTKCMKSFSSNLLIMYATCICYRMSCWSQNEC